MGENSWVGAVLITTGLLYLLILLILFIFFGRRSVGLRMFSRTPQQVENALAERIAPAPFYYKQRIFRFCYFALHTIDKLLLITSLLYSALTAYLVLEQETSGVGVACLVISTVSSTLKATLGLDKMAKPYIKAVRLMEFAILKFEYSAVLPDDSEPSPTAPNYQILLDANMEAEKLISRDYE